MTQKKGEFLFAYHYFLTMVGDLTMSRCPNRPLACPLWPVPSGMGPSQFSFPAWVTWSLWNARPVGGILAVTMPIYGGQGCGAWGMSVLGRRNASPGLLLTKWVLRANAAFVFQSHHRELRLSLRDSVFNKDVQSLGSTLAPQEKK